LEKWICQPLAGAILFLQPLQQRLDLRRQPANPGIKHCHTLPECGVLRLQLVIAGAPTIQGPHSLPHTRSRARINSRRGKRVQSNWVYVYDS
jgi:hypothetical protein